MARFATLFVVFAFILAMSSEACSTPIEFSQGGMAFVEVGDPGNTNSNLGYGAVNYAYGIGKYEVTVGQYCEFLNAVAKSDPYGLYFTGTTWSRGGMGTNLNVAGISRSGASGSYSYSVMDNGGSSASRPIVFMSAWRAMRYANWMSNGKGSGSTESGAYTLNGQTSGLLPERNQNAGFYIPTENEWYKSAYYDPTMNSGSGGYRSYATTSDMAPGNVIGGAPNQANILTSANDGWVASVTQSVTYDPSQNYLTDIGAFVGSASFYGTFDQGGNASELLIDPTLGSGIDPNNGSEILRGGSWASQIMTSADWRKNLYLGGQWGGFDSDFPSDHPDYAGFRLTYIQPVPEPSSVVLAGVGVCFGIVWHLRRRGVA